MTYSCFVYKLKAAIVPKQAKSDSTLGQIYQQQIIKNMYLFVPAYLVSTVSYIIAFGLDNQPPIILLAY